MRLAGPKKYFQETGGSVTRRDKLIIERIDALLRDCAPFLEDGMFSGPKVLKYILFY